jgi:hypothetical protein
VAAPSEGITALDRKEQASQVGNENGNNLQRGKEKRSGDQRDDENENEADDVNSWLRGTTIAKRSLRLLGSSDHAASDKVILAAELYSPLKTLYAQHIFSAFMRAAAKTMKKPIKDGADIRPANRDGMSGDVMWQSFTLHNTKLSNLA